MHYTVFGGHSSDEEQPSVVQEFPQIMQLWDARAV